MPCQFLYDLSYILPTTQSLLPLVFEAAFIQPPAILFSLCVYVFFYVLHLLAIHFHDSLHLLLLLLFSYSRVSTLRLIQVSCFQIV